MTEDRRKFARYRKNAEITLSTARGSFPAILLDYSPFGIRIKCDEVINNDEPLKVIYNGLTGNGHVIWLRGSLAGIELRGSRVGRLSDYGLPDLLVGLKLSDKTGMLNILFDDTRKTIYIKSGDPIFARSNSADESIGAVLLRTGKINQDAYNNSVEAMNRTGKTLGAVLVELGYIKALELPSAVRQQIEEMIENAFKLVDGEFEFVEGALPTDEIVTLRLSLANLIYRGIKGIDSSRSLSGVLPDPDSVLIPSSDPYQLFQDISLAGQDKEIFLMVDGKNTISDILKKSPVNRFETSKTIHAFLSTRILDIKSEDIPVGASMEDVLDTQAVDSEFISEVEKLYERCDDMNYYDILGIDKSASSGDIRKAYYTKVRQYHPDKYFRYQEEDFKKKLSKVFSVLNEAYTVLSKIQTKKGYDSKQKTRESTEDIAKAKFEDGLNHYKSERYDIALQAFGQAIYLDDSKSKYHYYYGLALRIFKKYKEAENSLLAAIKRSPEESDYIAELGHLYLEIGMKLRARRTFERALSISKDNKRAIQGIGALGEG